MIIFLADKYNKNVLEACSKKNPLKDIADYVQRVQVVSEMNSPQLNENANRVIRILKDSTGENVNEKYFVEPIEKILYNAINNIDENVNYNKYLEELESLNSTVSKFFEDVLVMDKDENVKNNRIALLSLLKGKYEHLTDFSKI